MEKGIELNQEIKGNDEVEFHEVTPQDTRRGGFNVIVLAFLRKIGRIILKLLKNIKPMMKFMLVFGLTILIVTIIAFIAYVFYRYFHPRLCNVNRSAAFESYMETFLKDVESAIYEMPSLMRKKSVQLLFRVSGHDKSELESACAPGLKQNPVPDESKRGAWGGGGGSCVLEEQEKSLNKVLPMLTNREPDELNEELTVYYKFHFTMRHLESFFYGYFARDDIMNEPRFAKEGRVNMEEVDKFKKDIVEPYEELAKTIKEISEETATWRGMYHQAWYDEDAFHFLSQVHVLNMMLNDYHDQIVRSYNTRKAMSLTLQFNIWMLYYVPYIIHVFTYRIPAIWIDFPRTFARVWNATIRGWLELGRQLRLMPCRVILMGSSYSAEDVCGFLADMEVGGGSGVMMETYKDGEDEVQDADQDDDEEAPDGDSDKDTKEGFTVIPLLPVILVGKFFGVIMLLAFLIIKMVKIFIENPFKAIMFPFFVTIGIVVCLPLAIIHMILSLLHLHVLLALVIGFVGALVISILWTLFELMWVIVITVVFVILWLIDLLTGGLVVKLMRCENLPDEWEHRANYAEGSSAIRVLGTMCCYPCAARFRPVFVLCKRVPDHIPDFCPQQQIIHTFRTGEPYDNAIRHGPYMFDRYPATAMGRARFRGLNKKQKQEKILDAFDDARRFYTNCYMKLSRYDYLNRHICSSIDMLPESDYPDESKDKLRHLCSQVYCRYRARKAGRYRMETVMRPPPEKSSDCLCVGLEKHRREQEKAGKGDGGERVVAQTASADKAVSSLSSRMLLLVIGLVILLSVTYSLFSVGNKLHVHRHRGQANPLPGADGTSKKNDLMSEFKSKKK